MSKKFIKIFIFSMIFLPLGFQLFALNQKDEAKTSLQTQNKSAVKETLKIDFRFNTKTKDKKNYLKWKASSKKVKDSYDAVSGASVSHSTGELLTLFWDGNSKNLLAPKGLRAILLFAVSNPEYLESDNFIAEKGSDGKIKISFTHRKIGYFIQTDEKGKLDLENGFFIANTQDENQNTDFSDNTEDTDNLRNDSEQKGKIFDGNKSELLQNKKKIPDEKQNTDFSDNAENTDDLRKDSEQKGKNSGEKQSTNNTDNTEISKNSEKMGISVPEGFYSDKTNIKQNDNPNSGKRFEGKLSVKLSGGILKISGKLNLVEYQEETSKEDSEEISRENSENTN
ncbi:MAG: hypothetical protein SOT81_05945 [Treponema sp.]|nr:hypothetical protein [Treponema sp.]